MWPHTFCLFILLPVSSVHGQHLFPTSWFDYWNFKILTYSAFNLEISCTHIVQEFFLLFNLYPLFFIKLLVLRFCSFLMHRHVFKERGLLEKKMLMLRNCVRTNAYCKIAVTTVIKFREPTLLFGLLHKNNSHCDCSLFQRQLSSGPKCDWMQSYIITHWWFQGENF
jgi:hypothetical protein